MIAAKAIASESLDYFSFIQPPFDFAQKLISFYALPISPCSTTSKRKYMQGWSWTREVRGKTGRNTVLTVQKTKAYHEAHVADYKCKAAETVETNSDFWK